MKPKKLLAAFIALMFTLLLPVTVSAAAGYEYTPADWMIYDNESIDNQEMWDADDEWTLVSLSIVENYEQYNMSDLSDKDRQSFIDLEYDLIKDRYVDSKFTVEEIKTKEAKINTYNGFDCFEVTIDTSVEFAGYIIESSQKSYFFASKNHVFYFLITVMEDSKYNFADFEKTLSTFKITEELFATSAVTNNFPSSTGGSTANTEKAATGAVILVLLALFMTIAAVVVVVVVVSKKKKQQPVVNPAFPPYNPVQQAPQYPQQPQYQTPQQPQYQPPQYQAPQPPQYQTPQQPQYQAPQYQQPPQQYDPQNPQYPGYN